MRAEKEADEDSPRFVDFLNELLSDCSCMAVCRVISGCMFVGQSEPSIDGIQLNFSHSVQAIMSAEESPLDFYRYC